MFRLSGLAGDAGVFEVGVLGLYIYIYIQTWRLVFPLMSFDLVLPCFSRLLPVAEGVAGLQWNLPRELQRVVGLLPLPSGSHACQRLLKIPDRYRAEGVLLARI